MKEQTINTLKNVTELLKNIRLNLNMSINGYPAAISICGICATCAYIYTVHEENETQRIIVKPKNEQESTPHQFGC